MASRRPFHTASDAEIKSGEVYDVYFERTVEILKARGDRKRVMAEVYLKALPEDWDSEFQPLYRDAFAAELTPVPGVVEALDLITLPTCVASSSSHDKLRFTLGLTGLYERFAGRIFSAYDVARGKPAPDLFLHAASRMGVPPAACAVVEDSRYGVEAARAAGMRAFGFAGGLTPAAWLEGPGTVVFSDMRELPALLTREAP